MNKFLAICAMIAAVFAIFYASKKEITPETVVQKNDSGVITSSESNPTYPAQTEERAAVLPSAKASVANLGASDKNPGGTGQPQNAVDFNAPGAGTAQQKSFAAAAATKAYKESQQQVR